MARKQPSVLAELRAIAREADKDVRGTVHEIFFGKPEGPSEPGTPLNPTPQMTTEELRPRAPRKPARQVAAGNSAARSRGRTKGRGQGIEP